jgi:hypothetical protein
VLDVLAHREKYIKPRETILQTFNFEETINRYEQHFLRAAHQSRIKLSDWVGEASASTSPELRSDSDKVR